LRKYEALGRVNFAYFFRIRGVMNKNSWLPSLMYVLLGYAIAANFNPFILVVNTIAIASIFMCIFALNNLFDYWIDKERNYIGCLINKKEMSFKKGVAYCLLPLTALFLLAFLPSISVVLAILFLGFGIAYSLPPFRLKTRKRGWLVNPLCAALVFLEGFFAVSGNPRVEVIMLTVIILLFHSYAEGLHILTDYHLGEKAINPEKTKALIRKIVLLGVIVSAGFFLFNPVFLVTILFSLIRLLYLKNIDKRALYRLRFRVLEPFISPIYSAYELAIYGILGVLNVV